MNKRKPDFRMYSYGEYSQWDRSSRELPKILNITDTIRAEIGTEFGYILKISGGKGKRITFRIEHPPFKNEDDKIVPSFEGEYFVGSNDYEFFLGDCIGNRWKINWVIGGLLLFSKDKLLPIRPCIWCNRKARLLR